MSIRGLDDKALARLKQRAEREGSSVNSLVVQILQDDGGAKAKVPSLRRHRDLDALAGTWTERDANAFERATAPFSKVDPTLWK